MIKVGNRYKVKFGNWVSNSTYEVVYEKGSVYIIGLDGKNIGDRMKIPGWGNGEYTVKSGMRYNKFWCVDKSELIEYYKNMEIE